MEWAISGAVRAVRIRRCDRALQREWRAPRHWRCDPQAQGRQQNAQRLQGRQPRWFAL